MNCIPQIAKALGVELWEDFKIENYESTFCFSNSNLLMRYAKGGEDESPTEALNKIIHGVLKIIKLPWLPEQGDKYWSVAQSGEIYTDIWDGSTCCYIYYQFGNCFKTKEDAEQHRQELVDKILKGVPCNV